MRGAPWLRPTLRAVPWAPTLVAAAAGAAVVLGSGHLAGGPRPPWLGAAVLATVVAGLFLGLDDPAHDLLDALPSGFAARLLHRIAPLASAAAFAVVSLDVLDRSGPGRPSGTDPLHLAGPVYAALLATALAVLVIVARRGSRPDLAPAVAAAGPLAWVLTSAVAPEAGAARAATHLWVEHPWPVTAVALMCAASCTIQAKISDLP